jgi:hypothetical protein
MRCPLTSSLEIYGLDTVSHILILYIHPFRALLCLSKKLRAPRGPEVRMLLIIRARRVFCSPVPHPTPLRAELVCLCWTCQSPPRLASALLDSGVVTESSTFAMSCSSLHSTCPRCLASSLWIRYWPPTKRPNNGVFAPNTLWPIPSTTTVLR